MNAAEDHQDPASGMFSQFVSAATCAADGRDAVLPAPSLAPRPLRFTQADPGVDGIASTAEAKDIAALSKMLCHVLGDAAGTGTDERDRRACRQLSAAAEAAGQARERRLGAAREVTRVRTVTRGPLSPMAAETGELTAWTGRLTYADAH